MIRIPIFTCVTIQIVLFALLASYRTGIGASHQKINDGLGSAFENTYFDEGLDEWQQRIQRRWTVNEFITHYPCVPNNDTSTCNWSLPSPTLYVNLLSHVASYCDSLLSYQKLLRGAGIIIIVYISAVWVTALWVCRDRSKRGFMYFMLLLFGGFLWCYPILWASSITDGTLPATLNEADNQINIDKLWNQFNPVIFKCKVEKDNCVVYNLPVEYFENLKWHGTVADKMHDKMADDWGIVVTVLFVIFGTMLFAVQQVLLVMSWLMDFEKRTKQEPIRAEECATNEEITEGIVATAPEEAGLLTTQ